MNKFLTKKILNGFTLAEVLITLLIIGIIASIVIPALINDTQDAELRTAWKKAYSDLSQATARISTDNGGTLLGVCSDQSHNCIRNQYVNYLSIIKSCDTGANLGVCWFNNDGSSRWLHGGGITTWSNFAGLILNGGRLLRIAWYSKECTSNEWNTPDDCGLLIVDTNGFKLPNQVGKDIFYIHIKRNGLKPLGTDDGYACSGSGLGCAASLLSN